jgi:hypothetical protein
VTENRALLLLLATLQSMLLIHTWLTFGSIWLKLAVGRWCRACTGPTRRQHSASPDSYSEAQLDVTGGT